MEETILSDQLILLTNDDGIGAPGLIAVKEELDGLGQIEVYAPDRNWSAAGRTMTLHKPLRVTEVKLLDGTIGHTTSGAPSDCVSLALLGLLDRRPNIVVSGINAGLNVGEDIRFTAKLVQFILSSALLFPGVLLNVNIPSPPAGRPSKVRITRLGEHAYSNYLVKGEDPRGRNYYWITGEPVDESASQNEGTDIWAIANGYISITPIHLDMTEHSLVKELRPWEQRSWFE
jgi:5'-nucleotidase